MIENQRIMDELGTPTNLAVTNRSLEEVLLAFSDEHQRIPIRLDLWSLYNTGVDVPPELTFDVRGQKLVDALRAVFSGTGNKEKNPVSVRPVEGVLQIDGGAPTERTSPAGDAARLTVIRGIVHSVDGQPAAGCKVVVRSRVQTTAEVADDHGGFAVPIPVGQLAGAAILVESADGRELTSQQLGYEIPADRNVKPLDMRLERPRRLTIHVKDGSQHAVAGAHAAIVGVTAAYDEQFYHGMTDVDGDFAAELPESFKIGYVYCLKPGLGLDYRSFVKPRRTADLKAQAPAQPTGVVALTLAGSRRISIRYVDDDKAPIAGLIVDPWIFDKPGETDDLNGIPGTMARTDADGRVTFDWTPEWQRQPITFFPRSSQFSHERLDFDPKQSSESVVTLQRLVELSGTVTDSDGKPVANASVQVSGAGYSIDGVRNGTTSGNDGRFQIKLPPHNLYMVVARTKDRKQASAIRDGILILPEKPAGGIDLKLKPATHVFGQLTVGSDRKPMPKHYVQVYCYGRDLNNMKEVNFPHDANNHRWIQPSIVEWQQTNDDGRFEFWLGPGKYTLHSTSQNKPTNFEVVDQKDLESNVHAERPEQGVLRGNVIDGNSKTPVPEATISGVVQGGFGLDLSAVTGKDGEFELTRNLHPAVMFASTADRARAGLVEIGADDSTVTIPIAPTARYTARLVDKDQKPLPTDRKITYGVVVHDERNNKNSPFRWSFGGVVQPDADGRVEFTGLVVGTAYSANLHNLDGNSYQRIITMTPNEPGDHDLGEIKVVPPTPYRAPTFEERIAQVFERPLSASKRNRDARDYARLADAHVLVTFADPAASLTKKLYKLYFDGNIAEAANNEFRTVAIPIAGAKRADAEALANELGVDLPKDGNPLIVAEAADGKVLSVLASRDFVGKDNEISQDSLRSFLKRNAPPERDGRKLFDEGLAQAKREDKRLFVQETATWCGPCHRLAAFLDRNRKLWEQDFIWVRMDIRWSQAGEIMKSLRGAAQGGYPWMAILNADGKVLATSNNPEGANIGFPSELDEIEHFLKMFRTTAQRMTESDFALFKKALVEGR